MSEEVEEVDEDAFDEMVKTCQATKGRKDLPSLIT
jgi:hypothetical protein